MPTSLLFLHLQAVLDLKSNVKGGNRTCACGVGCGAAATPEERRRRALSCWPIAVWCSTQVTHSQWISSPALPAPIDWPRSLLNIYPLACCDTPLALHAHLLFTFSRALTSRSRERVDDVCWYMTRGLGGRERMWCWFQNNRPFSQTGILNWNFVLFTGNDSVEEFWFC